MATAFTFAFTGAAQSWLVPSGVTVVQVECWGAEGGAGFGIAGGKGGYAIGLLPVTPGETLGVYVGGRGQVPVGGYNVGGWNGGGRGYQRASGGGGSDVRQGGSTLTARVIAAGGGGGEGHAGGGQNGAGGPNNSGGPTNPGVSYSGTGGGTQFNGGSAGTFGGVPGSLGQGGDGKFEAVYGGAGGGGGFYGGGGGGASAVPPPGGDTAGGGGSAFVGNLQTTSPLTNGVMTSGVRSGDGQIVITLLTPNAPQLFDPSNGATLQAGNTNRFSWLFSSPIAGDTQSAFDLRYRVLGAPAWSSLSASPILTPNPYVDVAPGAFSSPGAYEWQVRTYESSGVVGPWSSSAFFTIATPVPGPTITAPVNGSTISLPTATVTWSAASQTAYEVRRVGDANSANPDTSVIYWTSGTVNDAIGRSAVVPFDVNNQVEHVEVRVYSGGLWSVWADVRITVHYTPPAVPSLNIIDASDTYADILLAITYPTPTGSQPAVTSINVFRSEGAGPLERVAKDLGPVDTWLYRAPASGVDYAFMVRVIAANGTMTDSEIVSTVSPPLTPGTSTYSGYLSGYGGGSSSGSYGSSAWPGSASWVGTDAWGLPS